MANQYQSELTKEHKIAVKVLSRGQATVAEVATHFGLARQTVQRWARGIDVAAVRAEAVARAVERAKR